MTAYAIAYSSPKALRKSLCDENVSVIEFNGLFLIDGVEATLPLIGLPIGLADVLLFPPLGAGVASNLASKRPIISSCAAGVDFSNLSRKSALVANSYSNT